ncbi:MAG: RHS repeat-associated core domain-containing protein, partial [Pseudohongiellaceae bacterium]
RFPGQYKDDETGLHYNYFRDYDSSLGRYVESDPIGLAGGPSGYVYALNRPTFYIDLNGKREAVTPNVNTSLKNSAGDLFAVMNEMASMQCQGNMISRMKAHRSTLSRLSAAKGECHDSSKYQIEGYRYPQNGCITPLNLVLDHRPVSRPGWVLIERGTY